MQNSMDIQYITSSHHWHSADRILQ